jgi:uncharacterized protein (TIGR02466 family)
MMTPITKIEGKQVQMLFGVPLLSLSYERAGELNPELQRLIFDLEGKEPSVKQSNRGGWQSAKTFQFINREAVREILSVIHTGVYILMEEMIGTEALGKLDEAWNISAWANINRNAHFNGVHFHVGGFWSGVYYVAVGADSQESATGSGNIVFRNPTLAAALAHTISAPKPLQESFRTEWSIRPSPGLLLIFPSWFEHWVTPHTGCNPRLSIAFDISFRR